MKERKWDEMMLILYDYKNTRAKMLLVCFGNSRFGLEIQEFKILWKLISR